MPKAFAGRGVVFEHMIRRRCSHALLAQIVVAGMLMDRRMMRLRLQQVRTAALRLGSTCFDRFQRTQPAHLVVEGLAGHAEPLCRGGG